ncbi:hypothetical protein G6706_09585, partial [Polynucleobacter paneuropaeus]|nr:hypothetical protein [Polynucleobacter paneuropaeus]MBT8555683.1 hypothetical protein [Polynucleobacter paneuropaeus]MBT8560960.1 hypothetical protein [Polynucleobacter paneuropaeus]
GSLQLGSANAITGAIVFGSTNATLDLGGYAISLASITSSGAGNGIITNSSTVTNSVLSVSTDNTSTTFGGILKDGTGTGFKTI